MRYFKNRKKKKKILLGFTLVELLICIGIVVVLLGIVLVAVNPAEQFNKARDAAVETMAHDVATATTAYYITDRTEPWEVDTSCKNELSTKQTTDQMPACINDLVQSAQLQANYVNSSEANQIYMTECGNAVAVCYSVKSQFYTASGDAKYTKNGVINPSCPDGSSDCYICTFSTNDAQECFQALNPNGSLAIVPSPSPGQLLTIPTRYSKNACSDPTVGNVSCLGKVVTNSSGTPLASLGVAAGFSPQQLHTAYNLPCTPGGSVNATCQTPSSFGPQTIAIVDAYGAPTLESDLTTYSQTYDLPLCTKVNGCLTIVNQTGQSSPLPATNSGWALETSLDVQMAHGICQTCKILVVEANSNSLIDLGTAVNQAALLGATAISNSYGTTNEWNGEGIYDTYFNHPGTFITASSGDSGYGTSYPAASSNVISVGGTSLSLYANNSYASESVWNAAGSGCSPYNIAPIWQTSLATWNRTGCSTERSIADVSADADPNTGVSVYDSMGYDGYSGWWILGGTSVSSPLVSAALTLLGSPQPGVNDASFVYANASKFRDVTTGSNGSCNNASICTAIAGYDGPSGLGSPNFSNSQTTPVPTVPTIPPTPTPSPSGIVYALDDTKLLDTYAVFTFADPGIPSPWYVDVSFRSDFGGVVHDVTDWGYGDGADTFTRFAYASNGRMGLAGSLSDNARLSLTSKLIAFQSTPNITWHNYQQCGKRLYFRLVNYTSTPQYGPTNSAIIDCTTTVGVVDPPLSWYSVFNQTTNSQIMYDKSWDADNNGVINWTDYVMMSLNTKARAGGWSPPEIAVPPPTPSLTPTTPAGSPTPTPTPVPSEVWVAINGYSISRYNLDGTVKTSYSVNGLYRASSIVNVGSEVWVADLWSNDIFRLHKDGTTAESPIVSTDSNTKYGLGVAGSQVWLAYFLSSASDGRIIRYNLDGTSGGSDLTGNGIYLPMGIQQVGSQVWVVNFRTSATGGGNILRLNLDGTTAATPLAVTPADHPKGIGIVGSQIWVGYTSSTNTYYIERFNFDGSIAGSRITGNGLNGPMGISVVGSQVWVVNNGNSTISRFNLDGTVAASPLTGLNAPWNLAVE